MSKKNKSNSLRLHLSMAYKITTHYGVVYHTQPGSSEVEFVTDKFFLTKKKANKWLRNNCNPAHYIESEVVEVHLKYLGVSRN